MATVISDVDSPLGSPVNIRGTRRLVVVDDPTRPAAETTGQALTEDLADLVFNGEPVPWLYNRTREDLIAMLEDLSDYCATLQRDNRVVVFRRNDGKPVQFGHREIDTRMRQDVACVQHAASGSTPKTSDIERRLRALEEKVGL